MTTFIINKETGKIIASLSGAAIQHQIYIDSCPGVAVVESTADPFNKVGKEIDGVWQIVNDIDKIIDSAMASKILEINSQKMAALSGGLTASGENHIDGSWVAGDVTLNFYGDDYFIFRRLSERIIVNGKTKPEDEDGKLLKGRQNFKMLLKGKRRLIFTTATEALSFIEQYEDVLALADIIEQEKIDDVYALQEIEDIDNYDASAGWEAINGS